jgi:hypothetical protein
MDAITISVEIGEDRHLVIDLPPDVPVGTAEVTIRPQETSTSNRVVNSAREVARNKLLSAGYLVTTIHAPEGAVALTNEELEKLGQLAPGSRSSEDLLNEERGTY